MTSPEYFEGLYAASSDPWELAERAYERRKHALTVASLPRERYGRGFEPGCSIGALTDLLSGRCDTLLATDPVAAPLVRARAGVPSSNVTFAQQSVPDDWPEGPLDLIVLSELLYYLSASGRVQVLAHVLDSLALDGHLVLVHWRHPFEAATCTGDEAHREIVECDGLVRVVEHLEEDFRLDVLARG
ncbi:class I SAM-dependent methyltransferase [Aeromicrobium chenweiae]|uniref:SAM-dependent methyltransferase n=1 Tax=Aeromicrobium chenweiae TaxID=2079793 RepID=A0A2S0WQ79_9ACTN|nr:SAM-dependent methyltransferase [Aeromicrobium chenweiae]AWB93440.1 SAM-dependent methyltransferase [Aeromicrobium chenweiae]TGN34432.1 methyltransferase domain-containing protein [Aeromicrobium chenweiae]